MSWFVDEDNDKFVGHDGLAESFGGGTIYPLRFKDEDGDILVGGKPVYGTYEAVEALATLLNNASVPAHGPPDRDEDGRPSWQQSEMARWLEEDQQLIDDVDQCLTGYVDGGTFGVGFQAREGTDLTLALQRNGTNNGQPVLLYLQPEAVSMVVEALTAMGLVVPVIQPVVDKNGNRLRR